MWIQINAVIFRRAIGHNIAEDLDTISPNQNVKRYSDRYKVLLPFHFQPCHFEPYLSPIFVLTWLYSSILKACECDTENRILMRKWYAISIWRFFFYQTIMHIIRITTKKKTKSSTDFTLQTLQNKTHFKTQIKR